MALYDRGAKEALLQTLWNEKRGKLVMDTIYPLGVSITLDRPPTHLHLVVWGLLSLLRKFPEKAFIWSQHWGRTTISISPDYGFDFRFTERNNDEEKRSPEIVSSRIIDPLRIVDEELNQGAYTILLNHRHLTLERLILQVERMVDEVIWCDSLLIKPGGEIEPNLEAYRLALDRIWNAGIRLKYVSEDTILTRRLEDDRLPVRLYGGRSREVKIPRVLGAVILPSELPDSSRLRSYQAARDVCLGQLVEYSSGDTRLYPLDVELGQYDRRVPTICAGLTLAKRPHAGNLLLLVFAEMVRRETESTLPLVIESNDIGARVDGMVNRLSELTNQDQQTVRMQLSEGKIDPRLIERAYHERTLVMGDQAGVDAATHVVSGSLLIRMHEQLKYHLNSCGFGGIAIIPDSLCSAVHSSIVQTLAPKWGTFGFSAVRYTRGQRRKVLVLEQNGCTTACVSRAGFIASLSLAGSTPGQPVLFVDGDQSVAQAKELLGLYHGPTLITCEGCGIGFNLHIASGTGGEAMRIDELVQAYSMATQVPEQTKGHLLDVLSYFVLTRYATVPGFEGRPEGLSFFDYRDNQAFLGDVLEAGRELNVFRTKVADLIKLLWKRNSESHSAAGCHPREVQQVLQAVDSYQLGRSITQIILQPEVWITEKETSKLFSWLCSHHVLDSPEAALRELLKLISVGHQVSRLEIERGLTNKGVIHNPLPVNIGDRVGYFPLGNLRERGYGPNEVIEHGLSYATGQQCLIRKRLSSLELLRRILSTTSYYDGFSTTEWYKLKEVVELCLNRLSFVGKGVAHDEYR